jgi:iron complex outermembrane receptor protein
LSDISTLLFDVEGLEVLRGPQGTTFGRNTPTGAILVRTKRPKREFGGYVQAGIGDRDNGRFFYRGEAAIDVPLGGEFAFRLAGAYENDNGYGKSLATGYKNNTRNDYVFRGTLDGQIGDDVQVTLIGEHSKSKRGAILFVPVRNLTGPGNLEPYDLTVPGAATPASDGINAQIASGSRYTNFSEFTYQKNRGTSYAGSLIVNWDISNEASLRSITGFREISQFTTFDQEGRHALCEPHRPQYDQAEAIFAGIHVQRTSQRPRKLSGRPLPLQGERVQPEYPARSDGCTLPADR